MIKTLIKKELWGMLAAYFRTVKTGKKKSKAGTFGYVLLLLYVLVALFFLFFYYMESLCEPLLEVGMGWLYFALAGMVAVVLSVIGSVFITKAILYEAKDNELLLSLPIPSSKILFSRMASLYVQNFLFCGIVFLPSVIVYGRTTVMGKGSILFCFLLFFLLPLVSLALTCVLAWLTALLTLRVQNKTLFTMVLSLCFLGIYFYFYFRLNHYLQLLLLNSGMVGVGVQRGLWPLYQMGLAAQGDLTAFLLFAGMSVFLFGVVYFVLSRSFIRIVTVKRGAAKREYQEETLKIRSVSRALLYKEFRRFTGSAVYMLNCGLGTLMLLIGAVAIVWKGKIFLSVMKQFPEIVNLFPILGCAMICMVTVTCAVTSPSVSLEGRSLWLLQSLPVNGRKILEAKLKLHLLVTVPAAVLCAIALVIVLKPSIFMSALLVVMPIAYILLNGMIGLLLNLRFPRLDWTTEAAVIKQSMSVSLAIFSGFGILLLLVILYFVLSVGSWISVEIFLLICTGVMAVASAILWKILSGWGVERIAFLQ